MFIFQHDKYPLAQGVYAFTVGSPVDGNYSKNPPLASTDLPACQSLLPLFFGLYSLIRAVLRTLLHRLIGLFVLLVFLCGRNVGFV